MIVGWLVILLIIFYLNIIESLTENNVEAITFIGWVIYVLFYNYKGKTKCYLFQ